MKYEREKVDCPVCGPKSKKIKLFSAPDRMNHLPGSFNLYQCQECRTVFQNPRLKEKYVKYFYPDTLGYFQPKNPKLPPFSRNLEKTTFINYYGYKNLGKHNIFYKLLALPMYLLFYRSTSIPKYVKNGTLLDIGCSHGYNLQRMQRIGWKTFGTEPNKNAANYAREKRGLNVKCETIEMANFKENSFDVIILDMVIEHLYHPADAIKKITQWLKKDGQLIFSLPYFEGLEFRIFGKYCYSLHLPNHTYFYNKNSIRQLLKKDFSAPKFVFQWYSRDITVSAQIKCKENYHPGLLSKIIASDPLKITFVIRIMLFFYSFFKPTSRVTIFARKI